MVNRAPPLLTSYKPEMLFTDSKQRITLRLGEYLYTEKMSLLSISALADYFDKETKSLNRGENHYESGHVESFSFSSGIITGSVKASMKDHRCGYLGSTLLACRAGARPHIELEICIKSFFC